jgi:hypothetical protein
MTAPRRRVASAGVFYAGEAARILGLEQLDYRQLRALFAVAVPANRREGPNGGTRWSRYTFRDLVAMRAAFESPVDLPRWRADTDSISDGYEPHVKNYGSSSA